MRKSTLQEDVITSTIEEVAEQVYRPTPNDRSVKAAFWARAADNPLIDRKNISLETIRSIMGNARVQAKNWANPLYRAWFMNSEEHRDKLEYLFALSLDAAEDILLSTDPKTMGSKVNMIKAIAELAGKVPKQTASSPLEKAINSMDRVQLEAYLQKNGVSVQLSASRGEAEPVQVIDVSQENS